MGWPMGVPRSGCPPWEVSKELNGIRHVGCQFYSVFSTENESRVDTSLRSCRSLNSLCMGFTFLMDANTSKYFYNYFMGMNKVNLLGVDSLCGDCMFIPADLGS